MDQYYFEVITDNRSLDHHILVKAQDVIEAGKKASIYLLERGYMINSESIIEITRTKIDVILD